MYSSKCMGCTFAILVLRVMQSMIVFKLFLYCICVCIVYFIESFRWQFFDNNVDEWGFDAFRLNFLSASQPLVSLGYAIFSVSIIITHQFSIVQIKHVHVSVNMYMYQYRLNMYMCQYRLNMYMYIMYQYRLNMYMYIMYQYRLNMYMYQ